MKYTLAFLAALAGTAIAHDESLIIQDNNSGNTINGYAAQVPVCANLCLFNAAVAVGCDTDDYHCQCAAGKHDQLIALTHNCMDKSCSPIQAKDAYRLTNKICKAVKRGLPVLKRTPAPAPEPAPAPFPEPVPAPFPAPEAFPEPVIPDAVVAAYLARRGAETGCGAPPPTTVQTVTQASSIPSASLIPSPTATTSPSSVATAGAALHRAPAAAVAGAAVAMAALLL